MKKANFSFASPEKKDISDTIRAELVTHIYPGIVAAIVILQKLLPGLHGVAAVVIGAVITLAFMLFGNVKYVTIIIGIISIIVWTATAWMLVDKIPMKWLRIIIKIIVVLFLALSSTTKLSSSKYYKKWLKQKF